MKASDEVRRIFEGIRGAGTLGEALERLTNWASQANFRKAVRGDWGPARGDTATTTEPINVIPFDKPGDCRELLLVFSLGRSEFDERLRQAHDHCSIECPGKTKGIMFITDYWGNEKFWDSRSETFEKLAIKYGVIFVAGIWSGRSLAVTQIIP